MDGYTYAGRMLLVPGGPFVTKEETKANIALAHQILGTPKDAWHPAILFSEHHGVFGFILEIFTGCNRVVDVWIVDA